MNGPILIIDDDADDLEILKYALDDLELPNEVVWLHNAAEVLHYLSDTTVQPFIIFCDINMPKVNGIMLKKELDKDPVLRKKSIPFIFYTTTADPYIVDSAYSELTVQGFFEKGFDSLHIRDTIKTIMDYWKLCLHPSSR
jgi:CheY-like chemotaxis protein